MSVEMNAHRKIIKDNVRTILKIIVREYDGNYSPVLYRILKEHPDFPSFLAFQYVLKRMGKESFAIHIGYEELLTIPLPCLVHVYTNVDLFLCVDKITSEYVQIKYEDGSVEKIARADFLTMWDGNALLIDEKPVNIHIPYKDKLTAIVENLRIPLFIFSLLLTFAAVLWVKNEADISFYFYLLGILGGVTSSILLFIQQTDKYNIFVKRLCSANNGKDKVDCSSILDFKDAYFLGLISWTDVGVVYFTTLLLLIFLFSFDVSKTIINILSIMSMGYVCYSITYQKFIAKKWCTLCLSVQAVFVFLFILSLCTFKTIDIQELYSINTVICLVAEVLIVLTTYMIVKPLIVNSKQYIALRQKFNQLIFDDSIIQYTFSQAKYIEDFNRTHHSICIGNENAKDTLTLVFSPICVPCIKELQALLPIIKRKKEVNLKLIFLLDEKRHPESLIIAKRLVQSYIHEPEMFVDILLNYVTKYPISKNNLLTPKTSIIQEELIDDTLREQKKWCLKHKFFSTPVLIANNRIFPHYYEVKDIDYLFD